MTDPDELGGSAADRRFREALREGLAAAERESQAASDGSSDTVEPVEPAEPAEPAEPRGDRPRPRPAPAPVKPARTRSEVFMDWAPLAVAVLAIGAVIGIALYGIAGGDLGPW